MGKKHTAIMSAILIEKVSNFELSITEVNSPQTDIAYHITHYCEIDGKWQELTVGVVTIEVSKTQHGQAFYLVEYWYGGEMIPEESLPVGWTTLDTWKYFPFEDQDYALFKEIPEGTEILSKITDSFQKTMLWNMRNAKKVLESEEGKS